MPLCPIDEAAHFSVAFFNAKHGRLPTLYDSNDPEIIALHEKCYPSPPTWSAEDLGPNNLYAAQYEAVHPPFPYLLWSPLIQVTGRQVAVGLILVRMLGAVMLGLSVWIWFRMAKRLRPQFQAAGGLTGCLLLMPSTIALCSYANNGPTALLMMCLLLYLISTGPAPQDWSSRRALLAGTLTTLLALSFWYVAMAVICFTLWFVACLPWRRLRMALLPLGLGGVVYAGTNFYLYGHLTGLPIHHEIVSYSFESTAAKWSNIMQSLGQLANTLVLPEFYPGLPAWTARLAVIVGAMLLSGGFFALLRALWILRQQGLEAFRGAQRGTILGAFLWNSSVLLVILLPLISGHGIMLGRYLVPALPCLAMALMPIAHAVFRRFHRLLLTGITIAFAGSFLLGMAGLIAGYLRSNEWGLVLKGEIPVSAVYDMNLTPSNNRHIEGGITHPDGIEQRFIMPVDELSGIDIILCTFREKQVIAYYQLELFDTASGEVLVNAPLDPNLIHDNQWYTIEFQPRSGWLGRDLTFRLRPAGPVRTPVTVRLCEIDRPGFSLTSAGMPRTETVVFRLLTPRPKTFSSMAGRLLNCRPRRDPAPPKR